MSIGDKYNLNGGNLSLELSNENDINILISQYAKEFPNQQKYLKLFIHMKNWTYKNIRYSNCY